MRDNYFKGIGSFWLQFFRDRKVLDAFGSAAVEMLSSVYMELADLVLSLSHDNIPVYHKLKWDTLVIKFSDGTVVGGRHRFPLPYTLNNKGLRSAPVLISSLIIPQQILVQNHDFVIADKFIEFSHDPFTNPELPIREVAGDLQMQLWAPISEIDTNRIWQYYGHFIGKWNYSSQAYKNFIRGMFHTRMFGPIVNRIETGLQLVAGLPVADGRGDEIVLAIIKQNNRWIVRTTLQDHIIAPGVNVRANVGDILTPFQAITDTVTVVDYLKEPEWWKGNINQLPANLGSTIDVNKAFDQYLKYNTFLVKINLTPFLRDISGISRTNLFDGNSLVEFLLEFKPSYTYVFPLFFLRLVEEIPPIVSVAVRRSARALEDRHFGYPTYNTLSDGLGVFGNKTLWAIGEGAGISQVHGRYTTIPHLTEPYRQVFFIPYSFSELYHLSMEKDLSGDLSLGDVVTQQHWCSPVERNPFTLDDFVDSRDGFTLKSQKYAYRYRDLAMHTILGDEFDLRRVVRQGVVEEITVSEHALVAEELPLHVATNVYREVEPEEDLQFGHYTLSSGKDLSSGIDLGIARSDERYRTEQFIRGTDNLTEDFGGIAEESIDLSLQYDLSHNLEIGHRVRLPRFYNLRDEKHLDSRLNLDSVVPLRMVVESESEAQLRLCEDVNPDEVARVDINPRLEVQAKFNVYTLSDGEDLSDDNYLSPKSAEKYSYERTAHALERLEQDMEDVFRRPLILSDGYGLSDEVLLDLPIRAPISYSLRSNNTLESQHSLSDFMLLRMSESVRTCESAEGLFVEDIIPFGTYRYYDLSDNGDLSDEIIFMDGVYKIFTLPDVPFGDSLELYRDGRLLQDGIDYTVVDDVITFVVGPAVANVLAFYRKSDAGSTIFVEHEIPSGVADGVNTEFILWSSFVVPGSLRVYVDGTLYSLDRYKLVSPYVRFFVPPQAGSSVRVYYRKYSRMHFVDDAFLAESNIGLHSDCFQIDSFQANYVQSEEGLSYLLPCTPDNGHIKLFVDGILQIPNTDYILSDTVVSMARTPKSAPKAYYRCSCCAC